MDVLWQEGNEQRREALFHTTLSYLKRTFSIIGVSDLIRMDNKRYTMLPIPILSSSFSSRSYRSYCCLAV